MAVFLDWMFEPELNPRPDNYEDIYYEYASLRENKNSKFVLELVKEIAYLETKIFIASRLVQQLSDIYSRDLVMELKDLGFKGKFDWSHKERYYSELSAVVSNIKRYVHQLNKKQLELKQIENRHGAAKFERRDFDIWAITLWKYMGDRIDFNIIKISEWCFIMNDYERYCEVENAKVDNIWQKTELTT
jgi:hypothetical protein